MGAHPHLALGPEHGPSEGQQRAVEVGERDVLVDRQALELVELRGVSGVGVRAVHAPGHDDVQRRWLLLHRPDLDGRRVGAQQDVV